MGGRGVDTVDGAIAENGSGIDGDFVAVRDPCGFAVERISERLRIAPGKAEASVQKTAPEIGEVRMAQAVDLIIVSLLLGIVTNTHNDILGSGDRTHIFGSNFELAIAGGDDADNRLAILKREMERFRGDDRSNGIPLEGNVACELRL